MQRFLLILISILFTSNLISLPVSTKTALNYAHDFYIFRYNSSHELKKNSVEFQVAEIYYQNQNPVYYIFNTTKNEGFIIVSADDSYFPVIGYSFTGNFSQSRISPELYYLLNRYIENIEATKSSSSTDPEVAAKWSKFTDNNRLKAPAFTTPLLTTKWDQDCYYNLYTPSDISGPCSHTYAGCVATSMSQVMKYFNFPTSGYGTHSYTHASYGTLSANFGATTYDWTNMPTILGSTSSLVQKQAVARLMGDCGVAVDMNYSANGSGSNINFASSALSDYFRYNFSSVEILASNYTALEWGQILRDQIDNNMPVIYSGIDNTIGYGHAWVMDGYQGSNYFHMNWGWSGSNNGFFLLTSITTSGYDFTSDQSVVINIKPSSTSCSGTTTYTAKTGRIEDGSGVSNYANNLYCSFLITPVSGTLIVLNFSEFNTESNQDIVNIYDGTSASGTLLGSFSGNSIPPVMIANSGSMFISFTTNGSNTASGWKASWSQVPPVYCANTKFMTDPTSIFDDGSGVSPYVNNTQCKWLLKPTGATTVSLKFLEFNLHSTDHLYVYNGPNTGSSLLGSYTGTTLPPSLKSTGNSMLLYFVTNGLYVANGWKVSYFMDVLGIENEQTDQQIKVYPNPGGAILNLKLSSDIQLDKIQILNSQGQIINTIEATNLANNVLKMDISTLPLGFYFLRILADDFTQTKTFIKN